MWLEILIIGFAVTVLIGGISAVKLEIDKSKRMKFLGSYLQSNIPEV